MILIEHSTFDQDTIRANLGAPEYSYWFVRKAFRSILQRIGVVVPLTHPQRDADVIFHSAREHGEACVLLPFTPPQYTPLGLACPTVPMFAWEFDTIPDETWNANPQEDWRYVLSRTGVAVTHSEASADAVRRSMGRDYPVWSIPAPVFDPAARRGAAIRGRRDAFDLRFDGALVIDAGAIDLSLFAPRGDLARAGEAARRLGRLSADPARAPQTLRLEGVVYTAVFNPADGRKNWIDLVAGFVWAFRATPDAVLILKLTHADASESLSAVLSHLAKLGPFACRILIVQGMLSDEAYAALVDATSYTVNTSDGEGQCLPLMEFMSAGRPAISPRHTAMIDYVTPENAFIVASRERPAFWPHDERQATRCLRHEISFADYTRRLRESWRVADAEPARYARMSAAATEALRAFCSDAVVVERMGEVLRRSVAQLEKTEPGAPPWTDVAVREARA